MHLQEIFDLTQGQGHIKHYPLYHVTYVPAKFEVATTNRLGGDAFTIKYIITLLTLALVKAKHETVSSILYII